MSDSHIAVQKTWPQRIATGVWGRVQEFAGLGGGATYLWPRWLVIRAVGIVYLFVFGGLIAEAQALIGPDGLLPVASLLDHLRETFPNGPTAFFRAPSLFWISSGAGMTTALGWLGFAAAVAVVLNLWPRMSLFICWLIFLSFVAVLNVFAGTHTDQLAIEVVLLCIPYAPKGFRPGLGVHSPPLPIALFMVRFMLFRVMIESGLTKLLSGEPAWRNFTAMNAMYETAPFPTIIGFFNHQMPQLYHVFGIILTFVAELAAPIIMVFAGRKGRWFAFVAWLMLQGGIQVSANYGWLNTAAIGLALVLFDDQMLMSLAKRLRLNRIRDVIAATATYRPPSPGKRWPRRLLSGALWAHFGLSIYAYGIYLSIGAVDFSDTSSRPLRYSFLDFRSINPYTVYATFLKERYGVEFTGSNDGGVTWKPYRYPYLPQDTDDIVPFIAPRFQRFEASLQLIGSVNEGSPTVPIIGLNLLERNPLILDLFEDDPFKDRPATMIRMRRYQLSYHDYATYRETGNFWSKRYLEDYSPMLYRDPEGRVHQVGSALEAAQVQAAQGNPGAQTFLGTLYLAGRGVSQSVTEAKRWFLLAAEQNYAPAQYQLGVFYANNVGGQGDPREAIRWFGLSAEQGWPPAQYQLARLYAHGAGVKKDPATAVEWYRRAAMQGQVDAQFMLGVSYFTGSGVPRDLIEGLAWFMVAAETGDADAQKNQTMLENEAGPAGTRMARERSQQIKSQLQLPTDRS